MLHYADQFRFEHVPFSPPFGPFDYLDAIKHCLDKGASVIVVDSASHMHEGEGGMLDQHEKLLEKWCGNDWAKRERSNMRAWIEPKRELQRFVQELLQLRTNLVFCFRGKDKIKPAESGADDKKPVDLGTMAIADNSLIYEMTAQALLEPGARGVPVWNPPLKGEKVQTKAGPFAELLKGISGPFSEQMGEVMGRWALGVTQTEPTPKSEQLAPQPAPTSQSNIGEFLERIRSAADTTAVTRISSEIRKVAEQWTEPEREQARQAIRQRNQELQQ